MLVQHHRGTAPTPFRSPKRWSATAVAVAAAVVAAGGLASTAAFAASVSSAVFSGGSGTVTVGQTLYAKAGAALTLTVVTSSDTKCVAVTGAATLPRQTSSTAKSSWTFTTTAPQGDGAQAFTVDAFPNFNNNGCMGQTNSTQASYTLDNTGPVVSAALTPAPNAAGWSNTNTTVEWTATDTGSGVPAAQPFRTVVVSANGTTAETAAAQSDRLGNTGAAGSVTVKVDKAAPTITAAQTKNADGTTTVTFSCADAHSGIDGCVADGSTTNSRTVQPGVTVTGTATDVAGNRSTAASTVPAGDTTAPLLSGAPTTAPNGDGWYSGPVTIRWTASDPESGIAATPADTVLGGEGSEQTATATVANGAGLSTTATSAPPVSIDMTAPTTQISGTSNAWTNAEAVVVGLSASDNLSDVATTHYSVGGGATEAGTSITLTEEGEHTVTFWSTDRAGNAEEPQTALVKIDRTAPTITRAFTPLSYVNGAWTNQDVTVTFLCDDHGGSGLAGCTAPVTRSAEGVHTVTGTATDGADNSATDSATIRIDKTDPRLEATVEGERNEAGWYKAPVTVRYSATDDASGIVERPDSQVLGEGANQSTSATVFDAAGNRASAGVSGINVDMTPPELTGTFPSGWHTGDVTVDWSCSDGLSGPAAEPADDVVSGEGADLSSTASCTDVAGNSVTKTVSGIKIDRNPPTTTASVTGTHSNGWYREPVEITLSGNDVLSGVTATYYRVDGGEVQTYTDTVTIGAEGPHTLTFWSVDVAGNEEQEGDQVTVQIDTTAPTTTLIDPISPASGWFVVSGIPVAFDPNDGDGSGIDATYYMIDDDEEVYVYGDPFTETLGDGPHTITYWSVDLAGNTEAKATVQLQVDTEAPVVSPVDVIDGTWRNTPLAQAFTAQDAGSGLANADDASFTLEASAESAVTADGPVPTVVTKTVTDNAGNSTTRTVSALIDRTAPTDVTFEGGPAEDTRYYGSTVPAAATCEAIDTLSGLKDCTVTGYSTAEGTHTLTATAVDRAGNTATATRTYTVKNLQRSGFYAPVDANGVWNTIKGGNTVPLKFNVFDGSQERTDTGVVDRFDVARVNCDSRAVDAVEVFTTTGKTELRYDTTGRQFIQNWKTPTGSGCYKVTLTTVDNQSISALFRTLK